MAQKCKYIFMFPLKNLAHKGIIDQDTAISFLWAVLWQKQTLHSVFLFNKVQQRFVMIGYPSVNIYQQVSNDFDMIPINQQQGSEDKTIHWFRLLYWNIHANNDVFYLHYRSRIWLWISAVYKPSAIPCSLYLSGPKVWILWENRSMPLLLMAWLLALPAHQ